MSCMSCAEGSRGLCRRDRELKELNASLYKRLTALTDSGQRVLSPEGYRLANRP
jgi:hypothetical protein